MKKQRSFWLPSWKNMRPTSADEPQQSQTQSTNDFPVKDQQQPPSPTEIAPSDPQSPSSLPRLRRPSSSTISSSPVRQSQPVPRSSSFSRTSSEESEVTKEPIRKASGEPSTSGGDDAKVIETSKVNALSQSLPSESKALPSKETQPNEPLSQSKSQSKRLNSDKDVSQEESSKLAEVADLPNEKLGSTEEATSDSLRVKSGHVADPTTQNPKLETKPGTRRKSVKEQEDQTPTVEGRLGKSDFYGGVEAIPTSASNLQRSPLESENSSKENSETEPDSQTQAMKNRSIKLSNTESNRNTVVLNNKDSTTTTSSKSMKEVRSSQRGADEEEEHKNISTNDSSKRNEVSNSNTSNDKKTTLQKEIKNGMSRFAQKLGIGQELQQTDSESSICIITLAGENKGASMVINHHQPTTSEVPISISHRSSYNTSDQQNLEEENGKKNSSDGKRDYGTHTSINSNTQSINNSILHNSSCSERSPGVYFILNDELRSDPFTESLPLSHKPKLSSIFPTQMSVNELTTVRRRSLGLVSESSESSDEWKPQKPQRHECRFKCGEKAEG